MTELLYRTDGSCDLYVRGIYVGRLRKIGSKWKCSKRSTLFKTRRDAMRGLMQHAGLN